METPPAIGIDLGTTFSSVAVFRNGKVEVIANEHGHRTTPSYVSFTDTATLVGEEAKMLSIKNPENTIYDCKRFIGRPSDDLLIANNLKKWPFNIVPCGDEVEFEIILKNRKKLYKPKVISSFILRKMKNIAEKHIGKEIKDAVITVPAYFNNAQRKLTKEAGVLVGLNVLRIINEPTAASIAYGLNKNQTTSNILVFDLGGGTCDVSIVRVEDGIFDVKSTSGDTQLGGQDFTNSLVSYCIKERGIKRMMKSERINLQNVCEDAKKTLSFSKTAVVNFSADNISHSVHFHQTLFEEINFENFKKALACIDDAISFAEFSKSDIDEVVLVGGSTRIPFMRRYLSDYFEGKQLNMTLNPDECVAIGAAVQAAILIGDDSPLLQDIVLLDVTPITLGIWTDNGTMTTIIKRNTTIPTSCTRTVTTTSDYQTSANIQIYEGESKKCSENKKLDQFILSNLPLGLKGSVVINVLFSIDANGILKVTATETQYGETRTCVVISSNLKQSYDANDLD